MVMVYRMRHFIRVFTTCQSTHLRGIHHKWVNNKPYALHVMSSSFRWVRGLRTAGYSVQNVSVIWFSLPLIFNYAAEIKMNFTNTFKKELTICFKKAKSLPHVFLEMYF